MPATRPGDQNAPDTASAPQVVPTTASAPQGVPTSVSGMPADRQPDPGLRYGSAPGRRAAILRRVSRDGYVSAADLVDELGVSPNTIRRDLQRLASDGLIRAVRGGATPADATALPFSDRSIQAADAKRAIAAAAVRHIEPGTTVALDSGTTTLEIAKLLPADADLTVVTHSLPAIAALAPRPDITLIGIGGQYSRDTRSFGGPENLAALEHLGVRTLFLAATALDEAGVYGATPYEAETKRRLISIARDTIVVSDARKFELSAPIRVCTWSAVTRLITDALPEGFTLPVRTTLAP
ncbi:DeoR/GlpR family DNA-binding transcription regulator [Nonomuraea sp. N2-4H]|uniref:DeoR/GlpR family DNA-binding transcription regulator n=1 Tax=Nonomuraea sp. N2-4H TaxID=3128898 RepID=UPI003250C38C